MMKHFAIGMMLTLALVAAIVMGVFALAESSPAEAPLPPTFEDAQVPAFEDAQAPAEENAQAPADDAQTSATPAANTDAAALQEALAAYRAARSESRMDDLEAELNGFVAAGKLTQAQADLVLNEYKNREALRSGECPGCGCEFRTGDGFGRGGRMGGRGGHMGGMRDFDRQSDANPMPADGMDGGAADGTAFEFDWDIGLETEEYGAI